MIMVWVVSRFRPKTPPGISSSCISPLTSSGQRSRSSWASQPQKSATLSPQPGGKPRKFVRTCGGIGKEKKISRLIPSAVTEVFPLPFAFHVCNFVCLNLCMYNFPINKALQFWKNCVAIKLLNITWYLLPASYKSNIKMAATRSCEAEGIFSV